MFVPLQPSIDAGVSRGAEHVFLGRAVLGLMGALRVPFVGAAPASATPMGPLPLGPERFNAADLVMLAGACHCHYHIGVSCCIML
jgi:hypothetical protein